MKVIATSKFQEKTAKATPGEIRSLEIQISLLKDRKNFLPRQIDVLRRELTQIPMQISSLQRQLDAIRDS